MLWIIAPVYNEAANLESFVEEWLPVFHKAAGSGFVFCLLNDASSDGSLRVLQDLAAKHPELLVLDKANEGHGPTCLLGYRKALESGAEWIFQIDSDGQCDPADFEAFWNARSRGAVHYGFRVGREDGRARQIISRILSFLIFCLSFRRLRDANVPYRLMQQDALDAVLRSIPSHFRLVNVLLALLHCERWNIVWHPIRFRRRPGRQSTTRLSFFLKEFILLLGDILRWEFKSVWHEPSAGVPRLARVLLGIFAVYYILIFPLLSLMRIGFWGELEWLESVHMAQVHRILAGLPVYAEPSLDYTPVIYGPLYPYLSAAASLFTGEHYLILRLISLAAALGAQVLIWRLVARMTQSPEAAWVAAGLYAGSFAAVGYFTDLARVDSLALFFGLLYAGLIWDSREKQWGASLAVASAGMLAVLVKQTSLAPVMALSLWAFVKGGRQGRRTAVLTVTAVALSQFVLLWGSGGWAGYYLYALPLSHRILAGSVLLFLKNNLLPWFSAGFVLSLCAVRFLRKKGDEIAFFYALLLLAMTMSGLSALFKVGGAINNLIPFAAVLAIGAGIAMASVDRVRGWAAAGVLLLLLGFAGQLLYNPKSALVPAELQRLALVRAELFHRVGSPLFAPTDPYGPMISGKNDSAFWGAIIDTWMAPGEVGANLRRRLIDALKEKRFGAVVLKSTFFMMDQFPYPDLDNYYRRVESLPGMPPGWEKTHEVFVPR